LSILNVTNRIFSPSILSSLDSSSSLLPLVVKDGANTAGRTIMAKETGGEHESREKFIEEAGTALLWLGGIPLSRKIFDKTIFKAAGLNPDISIKKIITKGSQQLSGEELKKLSPNASIALTTEQLVKKYKHLHTAKFLVSTLVPFALLTAVLPKLNQKLSRKIILNRAEKEKELKNNSDNLRKKSAKLTDFTDKNANSESDNLKKLKKNFFENTKNPINFAGTNKINKTVGFSGVETIIGKAGKGLLGAVAGAEVNPVDNMFLLDLGISGNRVAFVPRNNQERAEYALKEGGILFFCFLAQNMIKKGFNALSNRFKVPVDLDFKTLSSEGFKNSMNEIHKSPTKENLSQLTQFTHGKVGEKLEENAFEFINKNHKNNKFLTLQTAKELDIIKTTKSGELNPAKYIEIKDIEKLSEDIGKFTTAMLDSGLKPEKFINKTKKLKTGFLAANLAICTVALGYVLPKIQYVFREKVYGSKEFPGIKEYKAEAKLISEK